MRANNVGSYIDYDIVYMHNNKFTKVVIWASLQAKL